MKTAKVLVLIVLIVFISVFAHATALTDAFVYDTSADIDTYAWNEDKVYKPEPILFIHGFNSHCVTWGGPDNPERLTINTLKQYFKYYKNYNDDIDPITLSDNTQSHVYRRPYLETIEFSNNLSNPRTLAKELAFRITGKDDIGWSYPKDTGDSILREYYKDHEDSSHNFPTSDKVILVAHRKTTGSALET